MRVIHVLRKPLSEGTVAANVLKHGCGGINIDASRIVADLSEMEGRSGTSQEDNRVYGAGVQNPDGGIWSPASGRWPANVILQHLDGCRCEGTKKVKGVNQPGKGYGKQGDIARGIGFGESSGQERKAPFYTDPDAYGMETVANWICAEGCPVRALDEQSLSGGMHSAGNKQPMNHQVGNTIYAGERKPQSNNPDYHKDKGGASRFFKQVGDSHE
jgi:hypothetical protein